jgi:hypothetical protein
MQEVQSLIMLGVRKILNISLHDRKIHDSGATKVAPLMEDVNKLIDNKEALVNQFDHDGKEDAGTSGAAGDSSSKFRKRPS